MTLYPFINGWLMVTLVSLNTYQIANKQWIGALIVGFAISWVWCFNVKSALGAFSSRLLYCFGATCGTATGLLLAFHIY